MSPQDLSSSDFPFRISSPSGLSIQVNANGSVRRMDYDDILLNLFLGTEIEGGPANLYLRRHGRSIDGGWRVYSSGAGISTRLALQYFLGIRFRKSLLVLDPMIPRSLDGLRVEMEFERAVFEIVYSVRSACFGPTKVNLNWVDLPFTRGSNPYRSGPAEIPVGAVRERLHEGVNRLAVYLG